MPAPATPSPTTSAVRIAIGRIDAFERGGHGAQLEAVQARELGRGGHR